LKPYEGKVRIFIINDSEAMTEEAQNALLKLLEEPAANQILILTAYNIAGLFPTVVSRCKVLKFNSLSQSQIEEFLKAHNTDEKNAILFSHMAMGSIGRALRFKEKGIILRRDEVLNDFFFRKSVLLNEDVLNEQMQKDTEESVHILLYWYRDLLISKFTQEECLLLNADRFGELSSYAHKFSREKLQKDILTLMETIGYLRKNINPKIALFNMALGLKRN
jgi:DNA polymerase-3 subunit delta'